MSAGRSSNLVLAWLVCGLIAAHAAAETTQGIITGRVADSQTGKPIEDATVTYYNAAKNEYGAVRSNSSGYYALPFLSPGLYRVRSEKDGYQAREIRALQLYVATRLELNFPLRPLGAVLEAGHFNGVILPDSQAILPFFGPDLKKGLSAPLQLLGSESSTLQSALSYVIDPQQLGELPLATRNVYTMIVTLAGVTAENVTGRGLGLAVNGQRPSGANFLLDGLENNDYLNTGPFSPIAPEGMQEYRVSVNNFSAESGRTSGFVANAVTRSGSNNLHGLVYGYLGNEALSANSSLNKLQGVPRPPRKQVYAGFWAGGPLLKDRLFFSGAYEGFRSRSRTNPEDFPVLVPQEIDRCLQANPGLGPMAETTRELFTRFPAPPVPPSSAPVCSADAMTGVHQTTRPVFLDRSLALVRLDYRSPGGNHRLMGRFAISRVSQPDFVFSVYGNLSTPLTRDTNGVALSYVRSFSPETVNELKFGWRNGDVRRTRPHPEAPILQLFRRDVVRNEDGQVTGLNLVEVNMPSSASEFDFRIQENNWEIVDTLAFSRGRHSLTAGGGLLLRRPESEFTYFRDGLYNFAIRDLFDFRNDAAGQLYNELSILNFALGRPRYLQVALSREALLSGSNTPVQPSFDRTYSNNQFFAFIQDNVKVTRRFGLSLGLRYESFGGFKNTTVQDGYLRLGSGNSIEERLEGAALVFDNTHRRSVYQPDRNNWAGRLGFSYDLFGGGKTVFRAAFGIFFDRPFDNLMLNPRNNISVETLCVNPVEAGCRIAAFDYLQPVSQVLSQGPLAPSSPFFPTELNLFPKVLRSIEERVLRSDHPELLWVDEGLRSPYVQSWFAAIQQQVTPNLHFEISHMGALGRKLIASDYVNRACSRPCSTEDGRFDPNNPGRINSALPDILYRSNSGSSSYTAFGAAATYRSNRGQFQLAYTWSHSIDNQSDALLGDVFNLNITNPDGIAARRNTVSAFTRQFDSSIDRGNSDFDLRHNLVFSSIWHVPALRREGALRHVFEGWQFAQLAGFRTGFPYMVFTTPDQRPPASGGALIMNRLNLKPGAQAELDQRRPISGGYQLADPTAFQRPAPGEVGNIGRNSLIGPGFWNVDISVAKSFPLAPLGEAGRIQIRADIFNVFNHPNLETPNSAGQSFFGPRAVETAFPAVAPLFPSTRSVQLQLKIYF